MAEHSEKEMALLKLVCDTLSNSMKKKRNLLVDRLDHNETAEKSALVGAAKLWRSKKAPVVAAKAEETASTDRMTEEDLEKLRRTKLMQLVCNKMKGNSKPNRRNALIPTTVLVDTSGQAQGDASSDVSGAVVAAANKWQKKKSIFDEEEDAGLIAEYVRRATLRKSMLIPLNIEEEKKKRKAEALRRFKSTVNRICILTRVFRRMRIYAIEKGQHLRSMGSVISENEENDRVEKDLMFNTDDFKNKYQFCIPNWAYQVCSLEPEERTKTEVQNLVHLMEPLTAFRRYSQKKQELLAKIVRYESFGRRRVVIRKGHIGMSFYLIYSGSVAIVIQGDEDKAFVDDSAPANIMKRGDSFGELALVKSAVRSATVVCLEKTEFFVVDKEAFFKLGIDTFSKEEIEYRHTCINSLDVFNSIGQDTRKEIADEGRVLTYLSDKVIDSDSSASQFIYFITKGCCFVLRLLDLSLQEQLAQQEKTYNRMDSRLLSTSSLALIDSNSDISDACATLDLPDGNNTRTTLPLIPSATTSSSNSSTTIENRSEEDILDSRNWGAQESRDKNRPNQKTCKGPRRKEQGTTSDKGRSRLKPLKKRNGFPADKNMERFCYGTNFGLGAFLRVDTLHPGQSFGLSYILQDGQRDDRKFALVSSGCEVIRVPRSLIKDIADEDVQKKIKNTILPYPSDKELYAIFNAHNKWRCFREDLVDHIAEFRSNMDKVLKERCSAIPKATRFDATRTIPSCKLTSFGKSVTRNIGSANTWNIPPSPLSKTTSNARQSTFIQEKVLASVSSHSDRTLVLTHGGSRLNELQIATKSPLLKSRNNSRALANYSRY